MVVYRYAMDASIYIFTRWFTRFECMRETAMRIDRTFEDACGRYEENLPSKPSSLRSSTDVTREGAPRK